MGQPAFHDKESEFYNKLTGRSQSQIKAYWARLMFTGKGRPPDDGKNDEEIKAIVSGNVKFIGYIDAASVDDSVKVIFRLE